MRWALMVSVLAACGGAGYTSRECPPMADGRARWRDDDGQCRDQPSIAAAIADAPSADAELAPVVMPEPIMETKPDEPAGPTVADKLKDLTVDPDPPAAPVDTWAPDPRTETDENGVTFVRAKRSVFCLRAGKLPGFCYPRTQCPAIAAKNGGACVETKSWACFTHALRTSGEKKTGCVATVALCEALTEQLSLNAEIVNLTECVIFRR